MKSILALGVALAVACLAFTPDSANAAGILRIGVNGSDLGSLDPHFATATPDRTVVDMIFNALLRYKPGDGAVIEPDLATSVPTPRMEGGKQVWSFTLRKGVMCHPTSGVPSYELTSEDVVYSLQNSADKNRSAFAVDYEGMTFEAPSTNTVKITLDKPLSSLLVFSKLTNYSGGFIICKKAMEKLGPAAFKTNPSGTGPFMFKSYRPRDMVQLVANPAYFRGKPQLDGVEARYVADMNSRELGLRNGELDVISAALDKSWVDMMKSVAGIKVDIYGVGEVAMLNIRSSTPPLDKLEVRKAIAYALNREEFLALMGSGIAETVYSPVPPQFQGGSLTKEELASKGLDYPTNRERAKKLLADAGYPNGFSLEVLTSEQPGYRVLYESMVAQLAEVGIKISLKQVDHPSYHSLIRKDASPLVIILNWCANADVCFMNFFHSDSIVVTGKKPNMNFSHYSKIDALIKRAQAEADSVKQVALWKEGQIKVLEDMVAYPIQYIKMVSARSAAVDYGHELISVPARYPGVTERTRLMK
jgi:peptide/nickel transport system substrate-binding protein